MRTHLPRKRKSGAISRDESEPEFRIQNSLESHTSESMM